MPTQDLAHTAPDPGQTAAWAEQFHRDGYLFIENALPPIWSPTSAPI